jgi:serine/threonine-protein kinase RsbW
MSTCFDIALRNEEGEITRLQAELEAFCDVHQVPAKAQMQVSMALEELVLNCIKYGYPEGGADQIDVRVSTDGTALTCRISDGGRAFDPFSDAPPPDLTSALADRRVGGLGVHIVKKTMDSVAYERIDGRNTVSVIKRLA